VSAAHVQSRFYSSFGFDPIFRLVDGATCPSDPVATIDDKRKAFSLLLSKGLIRIGLPIPANCEFRVAALQDPYGCTSKPSTGLTNPTTGIVSVYRRPLPSTSLGFLSTIIWDGREPSLTSQAIDATLGHAQSAAAPTPAQQAQIVAFETGVFTAQIFDRKATRLDDAGASGGPIALQKQLARSFIGVNDPLGLNPNGALFTAQIFDLFKSWESFHGDGDGDLRRARLGRARRATIQQYADQHRRRQRTQRCLEPAEHRRILRHLS
jgi:cytochrome c peroxidase